MAPPSKRPYQPDAQECAILLVLLVQTKEGESGKGYSRIRVAEITLKRLWGRHRLDDEFLREGQAGRCSMPARRSRWCSPGRLKAGRASPPSASRTR